MMAQKPERLAQQSFAGLGFKPCGCAGGMREGDQVAFMPKGARTVLAADESGQRRRRQKAQNSQAADGDDKLGAEQFDLAPHPARTGFDLIRRRHSVAALLRFAWKAAANGGDVGARAKCLLVYAKSFKPAKKSFAGGPGKRPS